MRTKKPLSIKESGFYSLNLKAKNEINQIKESRRIHHV